MKIGSELTEESAKFIHLVDESNVNLTIVTKYNFPLFPVDQATRSAYRSAL